MNNIFMENEQRRMEKMADKEKERADDATA